MPGLNETAPDDAPNVMHARIVRLQKTLEALPPKIASGETDKDAALAHALSGLAELAGVVEGLVRDYHRRF